MKVNLINSLSLLLIRVGFPENRVHFFPAPLPQLEHLTQIDPFPLPSHRPLPVLHLFLLTGAQNRQNLLPPFFQVPFAPLSLLIRQQKEGDKVASLEEGTMLQGPGL